MVRLRGEDKGNWPGFYDWLKNDFPQVLRRQRVVDAFTRYYVNPWNPEAPIEPVGAGTGSYGRESEYYEIIQNARAMVENAIRYGAEPEIQIMSFGGCRTRAPGSNEPIGTHPPSVDVALTRVFGTAFNRDVAALVEYAKTKKFPDYLAGSGVMDIVKRLTTMMPSRDIFEFAEATILHEMIHWRHWKLGLEGETKEGGKKDYIETHFGSDEQPSYDFEREAYGKIMLLPMEICDPSTTDK